MAARGRWDSRGIPAVHQRPESGARQTTRIRAVRHERQTWRGRVAFDFRQRLGKKTLTFEDAHGRAEGLVGAPTRGARFGGFTPVGRIGTIALAQECSVAVHPASTSAAAGWHSGAAAHCARRARATDPRAQVVPVEPKPAAPRAVSSSASTRTNVARATGWISNCAMRSPASRVSGSEPWLTSATRTSPR